MLLLQGPSPEASSATPPPPVEEPPAASVMDETKEDSEAQGATPTKSQCFFEFRWEFHVAP